ncbi:TMC4 isoform 1, partial [Pan troglodytes]
PESISSLPETTQNFLFFLGTQAFAVPLLLISRSQTFGYNGRACQEWLPFLSPSAS